VVIPLLQEEGALVAAFDPAAMKTAQAHLEDVEWCADAYDAAKDADALVILTEWNEFRGLDLERIGESMKTRCLIDLRNVYKVQETQAHGFHYVSIGRPEVRPGPAELKRAARAGS
jgi:UDPglucose 6-dehydrogenase